jgi:protease-4
VTGKLVAIVVLLATAGTAAAQGVTRRYAEEPTDGVDVPNTPLAGDQDARAVTYNPGGLIYLHGGELAVAGTYADPSVATSSGDGLAVYAAGAAGGGRLLPRVAVGIALEWLDPPRGTLVPDPGQPFRFTATSSQSLTRYAGFGVAWHHYITDGTLSGVDTFDAGIAARIGAQLAVGGVVRDIVTSPIAGTPVQRRYELEAVFRPMSTNELELAVGGRIGETRHDVDGWARASWRFGRGAWLHAGVETRAVHELVDTASGEDPTDERDVRATLGLELSFGKFGVTVMGTGLHSSVDGDSHALGGSVFARLSTAAPPSVLGEHDHIERVELTGDLGVRQMTALVEHLRAIARDPHVVGVVVSFDDPSGGWASFEELRGEVLRLRAAGKKTFAYMVSGTTRDYLVASACDRIYLDPAGGLRLVGLGGTTLYFRGAFDMLGVQPQFEKIGEYKSAPEEFTDKGPSEPAARMHRELFDSMWQDWVSAVSSSRHLGAKELEALVDNGPYTSGQLAKDHQLVDGVGTPDQISEWIIKDLGAIYPIDEAAPAKPDRWERPAVAVIYIDGDITDGKSRSMPIPIIDQKLAGGETIIAAIQAARADRNVKAIVLRIDSPGGSALASELIAREVFATRGVKPILCSMGDVAASGGYFVAAGCDEIFAEPMTITGSIGIFFGKFDISGLLAKLGITHDTVKHGARADVESMFRPFTDDERAALLETLRYSYGRFVGAVAEGRKMSKDEVDGVGRGHVWTGTQAHGIKLVDRIGGIGDALDEAKRLGGVGDEARVVELPEPPLSILNVITSLLSGQVPGADDERAGLAALPVVRELLRAVPASVLAATPETPQARLPYVIEWQ